MVYWDNIRNGFVPHKCNIHFESADVEFQPDWWSPYHKSDGHIYSDAVTVRDMGTKMYVARYLLSGHAFLPGKYSKGPHRFWSATETDGELEFVEKREPTVQILRSPNKPFRFQWLPMSNGDPLPQTAVQGGQTLDGDPLYIIKILVKERVTAPGYYDPKKGYGLFEYWGPQNTTTMFDILLFERGKGRNIWSLFV